MGTSSIEDLQTKSFWKACVAELLGIAIFVLVACGSCCHNDADLVSVSLCFGFSIASIVWAICHVSGGHINPAVTIGFLVTRKISIVRAIGYIISQIIGAILGALLIKELFPGAQQSFLGSSLRYSNVSIGQAFGIEFSLGFIFVFVVLASCDDNRTDRGGSIPLAVGLTITMCHLCAVPYTGAGMNPARSLGPALISEQLQDHWLYWLGPIMGGALGALLYDFVFAMDAKPEKLKSYLSRNYDSGNFDAATSL